MSELDIAVEEYLTVRRALGFKLQDEGKLLHDFVHFIEKQGMSFITTNLAMQWAMQPIDAQPAWWAKRLSMIRLFAKYQNAKDQRTEIPPQQLLPYRYRRTTPYIYSDLEIHKLIEAAKQLLPEKGLRPHTYSTLFGLLAVTGMRLREAINLTNEDVNLADGIVTIVETKFRKSRLLPIHASTRSVLGQYETLRNRLFPNPIDPNFLISDRGIRLNACTVRYTFVRISCQIGLRKPSKSHGFGPRLYDLRHAFTVRTLLNWYRSDVNVEQQMPKLATYLGHTHVNDTYWYLTGIPELLLLAVRRLENSKEDYCHE